MSVFFDTNILIYAQQHGEKAEMARRLLADGGFISVQVVNEFAHVSRRKLGHSWKDIDQAVADILAVLPPPLPVTLALSDAARQLAEAHRLSFYDALIVAAALEANCTTLFTEDLHDGQRFEDLTAINPFASIFRPDN